MQSNEHFQTVTCRLTFNMDPRIAHEFVQNFMASAQLLERNDSIAEVTFERLLRVRIRFFFNYVFPDSFCNQCEIDHISGLWHSK